MESFAKDCIIEALFLLMEKEDYSKISVTDLCAKAGVSRLSYYRSFGGKDDVIIAYFKRQEEAFRVSHHLYHYDGNEIKNIVTSVFQGILNERKNFDLILKSHVESVFLDYLNSSFVKLFKAMKYDTCEMTPYIYAGMLYNTVITWAKGGYQQSAEELASTVTRLILKQ